MHTTLKIMVVAFLLLFLASGVGIIYFYFQNMALGLEIEKLESSVADLSTQRVQMQAVVDRLTESLSDVPEPWAESIWENVSPSELKFNFTGQRVYGNWKIRHRVVTQGEGVVYDEYAGETDGVTKYQLVKRTNTALTGEWATEKSWADISDWNKAGDIYKVSYGQDLTQTVPSESVVGEVTMSGGRALILRGYETDSSGFLFPTSQTPYIAIVRRDGEVDAHKTLIFYAEADTGVKEVDFRAFVQSISLQ